MGGFMKEFLTIGELANIFNMDVQLLRHYDTKGLLVPQVRNSENNRRFYHFDQVYPLATIRYLRRLDYSLAQIKAFLHSNGLRDNLQMLSQQAQQLRRQCDELNATIQIIQQKVEFIEREQAVSQRDKFYVRTDLMAANETWVAPDFGGTSLSERYNQIAAMVKECAL